MALFYTGLEGWFNWRRTGIPDIDPSVENVNGDEIPVRFRYPESEQSLNADNYQAALDRQGDNDINTEMWLLE
ncbi:SusD/RagB family nutrient-binding outer membrane lipoprotein [Salinibacter sp.]|uniref:SusD/RagB family nutrient-binding outer membrane lipoprotein n=1 Tax=Salinibacter sp. TaxID=2065818 RepID=UPI0021E76C09